MTYPLEITIHHKSLHQDSARERITKKAEKMEQYFDNITFCEVTVDGSQQAQQTGNTFNVHIKCGVPGETLVVNHNEAETFQIALKEAFNDLYRLLEAHKEKARDHARHPNPCIEGTIARLISDEHYGFITSADDQEYYFHADHLKGCHFKDLQEGQKVHFIEVSTPSGMQAHRVHLLHHGTDA